MWHGWSRWRGHSSVPGVPRVSKRDHNTEPIWHIIAEHTEHSKVAQEWGFDSKVDLNTNQGVKILNAMNHSLTEEQYEHLMDLAQVLHDTGVHSSDALAHRLGYELVETPDRELPYTYLPKTKDSNHEPVISDRRRAILATKRKKENE